MPPTSGSPNPPAANPEVALDHHNAKVCHFFKLPRELRDMIWDLTTRNNIYISRHHLGAKITPIPYPASTQSPTKHGLINTPTLPSTLCRGQMINKLIFDESLPILSRNTEFSFHQPSDFEALVWQYKPIRRHITAIRIHDGERYTMRMEVHFAFSINSCPNLSKVSYFVQPDALRTWDSDPQVHPLDAVAKILPIGQLERMRGSGFQAVGEYAQVLRGGARADGGEAARAGDEG
ncbi:hypothetical protein LTR09_000375 [Extremus antarcticus]|uniref:Uncharacterized protein n=1 Tax=Extremus antarcticus TaxID=702011 RepID=A0AAJ0GJI2_9PEZI|nr:hypothetical protein LTR09_000375 [Extremus antarcticus]